MTDPTTRDPSRIALELQNVAEQILAATRGAASASVTARWADPDGVRRAMTYVVGDDEFEDGDD
jgi:hypothetical protein